MSDPVKCKKCKGSGKARRDDCGTCKGSGKVVLTRDENGQLTVTPVLQ